MSIKNLRFEQIFHYNNVANNAFFNSLVLASHCSGQVLINPTIYALSAPAWETEDFNSELLGTLDSPDWDAVGVTPAEPVVSPTRYGTSLSDFPVLPLQESGLLRTLKLLRSICRPFYRLGRPYVDSLRSAQWFNSKKSRFLRRKFSDISRVLRQRASNKIIEVLAFLGAIRSGRKKLSPDNALNLEIFYGSTRHIMNVRPNVLRAVLEHGQIRQYVETNMDGGKRAYKFLLNSADILWVTNLDDRTTQAAQQLMRGRWAALPHPWTPIPGPPLPEVESLRASVLAETESEFLMVAPASVNWTHQHSKGTDKLIEAFAHLRLAGSQVGLVLSEWGSDLPLAKELLSRYGLQRNVHFVFPRSRRKLAELMSAADVVLDQFHWKAFGALTIRALAQETPLITAPLSERARALIGFREPWLSAYSVEEIATQVERLLVRDPVALDSLVRDQVNLQRLWLEVTHSPAVQQEIQLSQYQAIIHSDGAPRISPAVWSSKSKARNAALGNPLVPFE